MQCDAPGSPVKVRIYFANGMDNEPGNMETSRRELAALIGTSSARSYGKSVNTKEGFIRQLLQVFRQRESETSKFWEWLSNMSLSPQWFRNYFSQYTTLISNVSYSLDPELRIMVAEYLQDLNSGKKVVIVSHSQGNFYANSAYQYIKDNYSRFKNSIGIVAVGTPAGRVQDGGRHTTNSLDLVINLVRARYSVLPANMTYDEPNDHLNHNFILTYLAAAGSKIRTDVFSTINRLSTPPKHIDCKTPDEIPVTVSTRTATNITKYSARLNGYVVSGKNIDVWTNVWPSSNVPSCRSTAYYDGVGPFNAGNYPKFNKTGLLAGTRYYYRVCGQGSKLRVSDGGVSTFKTLAPPIPPIPPTQCGKTHQASGSSAGQSVVYNVGYGGNGKVDVIFEPYTIPDKMVITDMQSGAVLLRTLGYVSGTQHGFFQKPNNSTLVLVTVYGNSNPDTRWDITVGCSGQPLSNRSSSGSSQLNKSIGNNINTVTVAPATGLEGKSRHKK